MQSSAQTLEDLKVAGSELSVPRLHHVGFVVPEIQSGIAGFAQSLGATWDGAVFQDPLQKVRVAFLQPARTGEAQVELVEPATPDSPVLGFLRKGGGLHHLCYEVVDLDQHIRRIRKEGATLVKAPVPAVAFQNRRIAWVFTRQKLLLEFLEQEKVRG